ncbi:MAG: helix-turn-helix domain-containing protein [Desulfuromonadaceae bacterium]|nr:helix-turn-helix domain-containing protein [Desulfuromonadaceae bacterium]
MDSICVITDKMHRSFYEALDFGEERLFFADLKEAYESLPSCDFSVIALDSGYNPQVGLSLLRKIKKCCVSVPIIFLTDSSSEEVVIRAFKAGAREYFKKPVDIRELQPLILSMIKLKRANSATRIPSTTICKWRDNDDAVQLHADLPEGLLKSVRYMNENLTERIYLDDLAKQAGTSKFHFCYNFKLHVGMTPMQFLTIRRIERAKILLRKGGLSITSVAYMIGFGDVSEFNRQFKKIAGLAPSAFKKSQVNKELDSLAG